MNWVEALGWLAGTGGVLSSLPQVWKLWRDRTSAGLSLLFWQLALAASLAWAAHGIKAGEPIMIAPNLVAVLVNVFVLWLIARDRALPLLRVYPLGVAAAAVQILVDVWAGGFIFGWIALAPLLVGAVGQFKDLLLDEDISGVSLPWLGASATIQALWTSWGLITHEVSVIICSGSLLLTASVNFAWMLLRSLGWLGPYRRRGGMLAEADLEPVEAGER